MSNANRDINNDQMTITVRGHVVTLLFSEEPNTQVASQIRQALLGMYLLGKQ